MGCIHNGKKQCATCHSRKHRAANPMRYAYDTLRANCIRRKGRHFWALSFEEFKQYAVETNYLAGKGRSVQSWTVDCIDPTMGYFIGNIKPMTLGANSKKHTRILHYEWSEHDQRMMAYVTSSGGVKVNIEDNPF